MGINLPAAFTERMKIMLKNEYDEFIKSYEDTSVHGLRINPLKTGGADAGLTAKGQSGTDEASEDIVQAQALTGLCGEQTPEALERLCGGQTPEALARLCGGQTPEALTGLCGEQIPWCEEGFYYSDDVRPGKHPYHEAGVYYIQEPSAMLVGVLADTKPGERVLDLCAAPGGKTTHLAGQMKGRGLLWSNEIHPQRAKILSQNVERMGITNCIVSNEPPARLADRLNDFFDKIVVDAPCSGEGMFRKNPDACDEWSLESVRLCAERQLEILEEADRMLRYGGTLVYSTCTFSAEENEQVIERFLQTHSDYYIQRVELKAAKDMSTSVFYPENIDCEAGRVLKGLAVADGQSDEPAYNIKNDNAGMPSCGRPEWSDSGEKELEHTFRMWPHLLKGEGHFAAVLKKGKDYTADFNMKTSACSSYLKGAVKTSAGSSYLTGDVKTSAGSSYLTGADNDLERVKKQKRGRAQAAGAGANNLKAATELFEEFKEKYLNKDISGRFTLFGDNLYIVPEQMPDISGMKILRPVLQLGTIKKNRFEPSHALALSLRGAEARNTINISSEDDRVYAYLRGESIEAENLEGWTLVCVDGYSLGWGKASQNVLKNHYPKGLRWN